MSLKKKEAHGPHLHEPWVYEATIVSGVLLQADSPVTAMALNLIKEFGGICKEETTDDYTCLVRKIEQKSPANNSRCYGQGDRAL